MTTRKKPKVSTDMRKVKKLLNEIPDERRPIADGIYKELVFMQNTMEGLKAQVEVEGGVYLFKQGKQEMLREHPALKAYNTTIQRYSLMYKQFIDMLPKTETNSTTDELIDFLESKK